MDLQTIWFILIALFFTAFFLLEGFDFGVGILLPFMSPGDRDRRAVINTIGPFWDGNEVWLISIGSAMFGAFPHWYATLFSGFYPLMLCMIVALLFRGVAFEFRSKQESPLWRSFWDWSIFTGSAIPALLWGIALANIIRGVPVDASMNYTGGVRDLFNPYALLCGLTSCSIFTLHGAVFLTMKTTLALKERALTLAKSAWSAAMALSFIFILCTFLQTDLFQRLGINPGTVPVFSVLALISVRFLLNKNASGWAFIMTAIAIAFSTFTIFRGLFPRVLVSSLNPKWSLTIYSAASSSYTLGILSVVALIFLPVIFLSQGWSYWIFRARTSVDSELEY